MIYGKRHFMLQSCLRRVLNFFSFDPAAESSCENLLKTALQVDPENTEALQALASVRMSQQRPDEAKDILEKAWSSWKDLEAGGLCVLS
jgi:cytochrome c-type biogenesis protein CcmH/NrfG